MITNIEECKDCFCSCLPVDKACIVRYTYFQNQSLIEAVHISEANSDIGDLVGEHCANALCDALSAAVDAFNASTEEGKELIDFLPQLWVAFIQNKYFQRWYAWRVFYHFASGPAILKVSKAGFVVPSNGDDNNSNSFDMAEEKQRNRMEASAEGKAMDAKAKFLEFYWDCMKHQYECYKECECKREGGLYTYDGHGNIVLREHYEREREKMHFDRPGEDIDMVAV